jgi:hypothetical protein
MIVLQGRLVAGDAIAEADLEQLGSIERSGDFSRAAVSVPRRGGTVSVPWVHGRVRLNPPSEQTSGPLRLPGITGIAGISI